MQDGTKAIFFGIIHTCHKEWLINQNEEYKMTIQEARDEFYSLIRDDAKFKELYEDSERGFYAWLDEYNIDGLDD